MELGVLAVYYLCALFAEFVYNSRDHILVAGNSGGRDYDSVICVYIDRFMP